MHEDISAELLGELGAFRKDLHRHPETAFELQRTAGKIADRLEAGGLSVTRCVGKSGVVATLTGGTGNRAIGLRADMDALPITEADECDHRSSVAGKFHGCGHDGHSTMLLGAALCLAADDSFDGTVHFIFQPDEENGTGAQAMIDDGLFERFPMEAVYGMHNMPGLPLGHFAIQAGPFCTFEDNFEIAIHGRGGHASMPELAIDPIIIGANIVLEVQTIVSRSVSAKHHAVVSVTDFESDGARNILASNVTITGDCRGFDAGVSGTIERRMEQIVKGACGAHGASYLFNYSTSFEPLINDPGHTALCAEVAQNLKGAFVDGSYGRVGFSEDFAKMLNHKPGGFILMGNGTEGRHAQPLHNPSYDFNDAAIAHGVAYWRKLADAALRSTR